MVKRGFVFRVGFQKGRTAQAVLTLQKRVCEFIILVV